jgi:hypothetical protein
MVWIMPDTLVLLARITVQVTASKASAMMAAATHQTQVLLDTDFILMTSLPYSESKFLY